MLIQLSRLIEKHPWLVITIILLITIGFSTLLPSLEMKTDFKDFMPDDETVKANMRLMNYFGQNQQIILTLVEKQQADSVTTPEALREQCYIQKQLSKNPDIVSIFGLSTLIDQVCQLEYGKTFENCSDEQIKTVLKDILEENGVTSIKIFNKDDPNEEVDYNRSPRLLKGRSADEMDIKNCYLDFNDETITFTIEVYDLSFFESKLKSPILYSNVFEWYIEFENLIKPDERLDFTYKVAAHFEPKYPLWEIGKGFISNIKAISEHAKNQQLFTAYKKEVYLWIKPKNQTMSFPIPLRSSEVQLDLKKKQINIKIPREEIGRYGIAPRFGSFELPAKLTNFRAGTRYYETPIFKLPWFRISANTSFLFDKLSKIREKTYLSDITGRILKKTFNYTWEDLDMFFNMSDENLPLPDQIALKDIEKSWVNCDIIPDKGVSTNLVFYKPFFFKDLQNSAKGFLPKGYNNRKTPSCIMIIGVNSTGLYEEDLKTTKNVLNQLEKIDSKYNYVHLEGTSEGVISTQINEITSKANQIIMPMIFIIIIIILLISFRKTSYVILPLIALSISIIWTFGTMVLLDIPFSTMAVAVVPLLLGLGVDYSVHLSHSYRSELATGRTPAEAIKLSVIEIGEAMFLAMLTTVIAFLSFLTATVPPMRDFGLILALGIIYTFITALTLQPAVRYLLDRRKKRFNNKKKKTLKLNKLMGKAAKKILKHQKKVIATLLLVTFVTAAGATQLRTEFDFNSFLPSETPSIKLYEKIRSDFPYSSQDQEYILLEGDIATVETLKGIAKTHVNLEDDTLIAKKADGSLKTTSIYTILREAVNNNESLIEEFNLDEKTCIPKTSRDIKRLYDYLYNSIEYGFQTKTILHKKTNGEYDAAVIDIYVTLRNTDGEEKAFNEKLETLNRELNEDIENYGNNVNAIVTGPMIITYKVTTSLTQSQILSTIISLVLAAVVLIVVYRRPTLGLIAMIPVILSMIWILGTMYFAGYTLNVMTITVTSLTIGIGVDYAIHATERFRLVADKTGNIKKAVTETISRTGGALLIAAMTTCLGFAVLIFAPIPPQVQFGIITSTTILFSFVTSVLLLPLVLARWAKWSKKKRGYIISPNPPDENYLLEIEE